MAINKVVYGNDTLIDLTEDSVEANNLLEGETAHDRSGNPVTGTAKQGHVVQDDSGTNMTQRGTIQFKGLNVTDDSTNGKTVVEATKTSVGLGNVPNVTTDNQTPTVTEASERENITAGDTLKTIIGKIKKWFTDLPSMFVSKSGDTMSGSLQINKPSASTSTEVSNLYLGNNIAGGTTGNSYGALTLFGKGTYKGRFVDIGNVLTADRDYQLPNKSGTLALTSDFDDITRPSRASVSVLTYSATLSEGIHFYTTSGNTADNPATGSHMFMIFRAATGITIFGMSLASRDAFLNASANNGTTWSGWLNIMDFVSKASGGTFGGGINIDQKNGTASSVGNSSISLGNSTPQGTDKNSRGLLVIWGKGNCFGQIFDNNTNGLTANRNYYLPDKSGTIALTSDIGNLVSTYTNQTIPANSKTYIANVIQNTSVLLIPYTSNSDCIPYITTASGWLQLYVYNMGNTDRTIDVTVRRVI